MYIAEATYLDGKHQGSTRLHCDMTCAVNVLVYTVNGGHALWHLWPPIVVDKLCGFMRSHFKLGPNSDPINEQQHYLNPADIAALKAYGAEPVVVKQHLGQAVFIPAGWPHQVC